MDWRAEKMLMLYVPWMCPPSFPKIGHREWCHTSESKIPQTGAGKVLYLNLDVHENIHVKYICKNKLAILWISITFINKTSKN